MKAEVEHGAATAGQFSLRERTEGLNLRKRGGRGAR